MQFDKGASATDIGSWGLTVVWLLLEQNLIICEICENNVSKDYLNKIKGLYPDGLDPKNFSERGLEAKSLLINCMLGMRESLGHPECLACVNAVRFEDLGDFMVHMDNLCTAIRAMSVCIPFNSSPWQYAATLRVAHESHLHSKKYAPGNDAERRLMTRVKRSAQIIDGLYLRQPTTFEEKIEAFTIPPPLPQRIPSTIPSPPACKQDDAAWTNGRITLHV